jgi:hypothetical protein
MTSPACFSDTFSYTAADGHGDVSNSATVTVQMSLNGVTVTGTAQEGQTLTANPTNVESVTGYQWQSSNNGGTSWTNISSATNSTYLVQEADETNLLRVEVTWSGGTSPQDSAATSAVIDISPTLTTPVISGPARQGQTLTATAAIANDSDATVSYQWQANHGSGFVNITGATSLTYAVQHADVGATLRIVATSTDTDGPGTTVDSAAITVIRPEHFPPPGGTAVMIMHNPNTGDYEIYTVGNNQILAADWLGTVGSPWNFETLGTFHAGAVSDMLLRNASTGAFEAYYVESNNIVGAVQAGTVGLDWNFSGVGSFTGTSSLSQILLRNAASGSFELYQITSGGVLDGQAVAPVGNNFQVKGFGHFSQNTTTQMLMQDTSGDASSGQLELYTYQPSTASFGGINVGKVGLNLNIVGTADLRGIGSTQMVMQQDNGNFWLYTYDPNTNSLSGQLVGAIGSNFHVVGFGTLGVAGKDEMLMQDAAGHFEVYQYNASLNVFVGQSMGAVGAPWVLNGIAAAPSVGGGAADTSNAQLVQAMAGFGGGNGAGESLNAASLTADTSQQTLLTAPHG